VPSGTSVIMPMELKNSRYEAVLLLGSGFRISESNHLSYSSMTIGANSNSLKEFSRNIFITQSVYVFLCVRSNVKITLACMAMFLHAFTLPVALTWLVKLQGLRRRDEVEQRVSPTRPSSLPPQTPSLTERVCALSLLNTPWRDEEYPEVSTGGSLKMRAALSSQPPPAFVCAGSVRR